MSGAATNPQVFPSSTISEDTLHYSIHLPPGSTTTPESYAALVTSRIQTTLAQYSPFNDGTWLWHKDSWELKVVRETDLQDRRFERGEQVSKVRVRFQEEDGDEQNEDESRENGAEVTGRDSNSSAIGSGRRLEGRMRIGDSVDDEWLVVWLLRDISKTWPELLIS
jgi:hypothetical protein